MYNLFRYRDLLKEGEIHDKNGLSLDELSSHNFLHLITFYLADNKSARKGAMWYPYLKWCFIN